MKTEFIYLRVVVALFLTVFLWFWAAPTCFNWESNIAIPLGVICAVLAPLLDYWIIKPIFKSKSNESNESNESNQSN